MTHLKPVLLVALTLGALFFLIEAGILVRRLQMAVPGIVSELDATLTDTRRTVVIVGGAATNIEKETRQWKDESSKQAVAATQATQQLNTDLKSMDLLISTANSTLLTQSASFAALQADTSKSINGLTEKAGDSLNSLSMSASSLSQKLPVILDNLSDTSAQTVTISKNVASGTEELSATTHDIRQVADAFRDDYLKPKNRIWLYFKTIVGLGSSAGNIAGLAH